MTSTPARQLLPPPTLKLLLALAAILAGLYGIDRSLARIEVSEVQSQAAGLYREGEALHRSGRLPEAIEKLHRAHSLERGNRDYTLGLAGAEIDAHQPDAAHTAIDEVLQNDPNNGRANLLMARLLTAENRFDEADSYYHRAIYGTWPGQSDTDRLNARLELIDLLVNRNSRKELLAETLVLESEAGMNPAIASKIPELYLRAGSPSRAKEVYQRLISQSPNDPELYAELGRTELLVGDFPGARTAFLDAIRRKPSDPKLAAEYRLVTQAIELDPTPRRQTSQAKYSRSMRILELAVNDLTACAAGKQMPPETRAELDDAARILASKPPRDFSNELAEQRLSLAERLWRARVQLCGPPPAEEPLSLIMSKLAQ